MLGDALGLAGALAGSAHLLLAASCARTRVWDYATTVYTHAAGTLVLLALALGATHWATGPGATGWFLGWPSCRS